MPQQSRSNTVRILTTAVEILPENPDRSSYRLLNQHANVAVYVCSGRSGGPHVATAGVHEGEMIGPNGGAIFDNDDKDCVFAVATAVNERLKVFETVKSIHTIGAQTR